MSARWYAALFAGAAATTMIACRPAVLLPPVATDSAGWRQYAAPEDAAFSSDDLRAIREAADSARSAAVMVVHRGNVVAAWGDVRRRFQTHSIRKSIAGALYGIAAD